jgi:hypothetical protein
MNLPLDGAVLTGLMTVQVNVSWPRFIVSMIVLAAMLGYMVYRWMKR